MLFELGEEIRKARKFRKVTQDQIARALGMSRATISQLEAGTVQELGIRKVMRILEYLGLELRVRKASPPPILDELREERWEAECSLSGKRRRTP